MMENPSTTSTSKNFAEATTPKSSLGNYWLRSLTIIIMGIMHSIRSTYAAVEESKRRQLRNAESGLLRLYPPDDSTTIIEAVSTKILRSAVHAAAGPPPQSLPETSCSHKNQDNENGTDDVGDLYYSIHTLKITGRRRNSTAPTGRRQQKSKEEEQEEPPLVLLHGYMNGAGYFYRNFAGLARSFPQTYALDLLGWGLSSRPKWPVLRKTTGDDPLDVDPIAATERFFCNSLEAWRETMHIDKMILAGHSMGGYLAVAYAERYPHRVDRLVLISPVGVPVESAATVEKRSHQRRAAASLSSRLAAGCWHFIYRFGTPGDVLRYLPTGIGRSRLQWYVEKRLPAIDRAEERTLLADYLYHNATLPGSGEYCLQHLLTASLYGKRPLVDRIPYLPIAACHFLYGEHDWMDAGAGLEVQERCGRLRHRSFVDQDRDGRDDTATTAQHLPPPKVTVHRVRNAGHLLMLDNPDEFNNGLAMVASRSPALVVGSPLPIELRPWTVGTALSSSTQHSGDHASAAGNDGEDNKDE